MHAITIPYDKINECMHRSSCMRAKGLKEQHNYFFTAINNNCYTHTDWCFITIVQTSKLTVWQKRLVYSPAGLLGDTS